MTSEIADNNQKWKPVNIVEFLDNITNLTVTSFYCDNEDTNYPVNVRSDGFVEFGCTTLSKETVDKIVEARAKLLKT